ncbi:MAG: valine--tRNA ligase [bacterium]
MALEKKYDSKSIESKWKQYWIDNKIFKFDPRKPGKIYSVDTPPPTVSGSLHIGHIFSYTHTDIQVRYFRMKGFNVYYPMGFDDNGLPSEILTEKDLKIKATDLPRNEFVEKCYQTCKKYEQMYQNLWEIIALSVDWDEVYTTIQESSRRISQRSFIHLLKQQRIYYQQAPVMWCPKCQTAIAQAEIEEKMFNSKFNDLIFELPNRDPLVIATTRPELLASCVAVFIHPEDNRYEHLINKSAGLTLKVPVFGQEVPLITDPAVDKEKGTGVVMCCTFGDRQDIEWWQKHELPLKISIDERGRMNDLARGFEGLIVEKARKEILAKADEMGLVKKSEDISHQVNTHERCGTPVEFLSKKQWFLKVMDLKDELIARADEINWYPDFMKKRYIDWVRNLAWDWCLSRQRFYGVPIPVWHCNACGKFILPEDEHLPIDPIIDKPPDQRCPHCQGNDFTPETDILDTWATSSLTPDLNFRWGEKDQKDYLYPMQLRPQAHEIIRTWTFYTILKSHLHHDSIPWENVVISGFVTIPSQDPGKVNIKGGKKTFKAEKISKSKHGDIASPLKLLERYSADILRYWSANASPGYDMQFKGIEEIEVGKKVVTKIWNSFRFISMHLEGYTPELSDLSEAMDNFIIYRLNQVISACTDYFDHYDFRLARNTVIEFFWKEFCDNYLEIVKDRLYNAEQRGEKARKSALFTLYTAGRAIIGLLAPFLPYITEEIYDQLFTQEGVESIHLSKWPQPVKLEIDDSLEIQGNMFFELLAQLREFRGSQGLSQKAEIAQAVLKTSSDNLKLFENIQEDFLATTHILNLKKVSSEQDESYSLEFV